jgi:hypothetical protein
LLLTPEESQPPPELAALTERLARPLVLDTPMAELCEPTRRNAELIDGIVVTATAEAQPVESAPAFEAAAPELVITETPTAAAVGEAGETAAVALGAAYAEVIVPPRSPLRMEAAAPVYLRPRDALNWVFGATSGAAS